MERDVPPRYWSLSLISSPKLMMVWRAKKKKGSERWTRREERQTRRAHNLRRRCDREESGSEVSEREREREETDKIRRAHAPAACSSKASVREGSR